MSFSLLPDKTETSPSISLRLLGTFAIEVRGENAPSLSRSSRAMIALLALRGGSRGLERDSVATLLWPDSDDEAARYNLRRTLTEVRTALGLEADRLVAPATLPRTLRLDLSGDAYYDVADFDTLTRRGDESALQTAVSLYGESGALLEGERGEWLLGEREQRRLTYLEARERLAVLTRTRGDIAAAIVHLRAVLFTDPMRETAGRDLMRLLHESGQSAAATTVYRDLRTRLNETVAQPDAETTALYERLSTESRRARAASLRASKLANPQSGLSAGPQHTLPQPLSAVVGRDRDRAEVVALLTGDKGQTPARLVTLTGAGGVGKTTLAVAVAQAILPEYSEGATFVDLAPLTEAMQILPLIVRMLDMPEASRRLDDRLIERIVDTLRAGRRMLLLDNAEHLVADVARLARTLLRDCPGLTILATSREPLRVPGEVIWRVPGLAEEDAARLFLVRATEADSRFHPQRSQQDAVRAIVTRLDGIPLAIEMAAARTRALPVTEIAARLDNAFRLLAVPGGDLLPRHQTLRATLDWSYDLLTPPEQALLARLSIFAGGWTLAAAEAICSGGHTTYISEDEVFDVLASLIEKSLVQFQFGDSGDFEDEAHYRMLETVRQYAREKLKQSGEEAPVRMRHVEFFVAFAEDAEPHLRGSEQVLWLNRLETEHDNLRATLDACAIATAPSAALTAEGTQSVLLGLRLSGALWTFWEARGYLTEGRAYLTRALAGRPMAEQAANLGSLDATVVGKAVADALLAAGNAAKTQGDSLAARSLLEESLALYREIGGKRGVASTLNNLGNIADNQGDYAEARSRYEESLAIYREIDDKQGLASTLSNLGNVPYHQGNYAEARSRYEEGLAFAREIGNKKIAANTLNNLGTVALYQNDYIRARSCYEESLGLGREIGDKRAIANTLNNLGLLTLYLGDYVAACPLYEECLVLYRETGDRKGVAITLNNLGNVAAKQDEYPKARSLFEESLILRRDLGDKQGIAQGLHNIAVVRVRLADNAPSGATPERTRGATLWAASNALRASIGEPLSPGEQAEVDSEMAQTQAALSDDAAWAAAWAEGTALSWEQGVELALRH